MPQEHSHTKMTRRRDYRELIANHLGIDYSPPPTGENDRRFRTEHWEQIADRLEIETSGLFDRSVRRIVCQELLDRDVEGQLDLATLQRLYIVVTKDKFGLPESARVYEKGGFTVGSDTSGNKIEVLLPDGNRFVTYVNKSDKAQAGSNYDTVHFRHLDEQDRMVDFL